MITYISYVCMYAHIHIQACAYLRIGLRLLLLHVIPRLESLGIFFSYTRYLAFPKFCKPLPCEAHICVMHVCMYVYVYMRVCASARNAKNTIHDGHETKSSMLKRIQRHMMWVTDCFDIPCMSAMRPTQAC